MKFALGLAMSGAVALAACSPSPDREPPPAAEAQTSGGVADPVRFVKAAYGLDPQSPDKPSRPEVRDAERPEYSKRLRDLFALADREGNADEVGRLDMDIYTGAQDGELKDIKVAAADVADAAPPRRIVTARFVNFDQPTVMHFYFERQGDRWFLDDIASEASPGPQGAPAWMLSNILKYGWP